ncbi:winged helix-turn-helix transcriptional regulator [Zhongshania arctica]|uniref:Winged helix-turn-helix transcriptional regulator n=1 Tax=Zhongshania arctica TaxID=3238302 RepID=A0ABV3TXY8_9GAMM
MRWEDLDQEPCSLARTLAVVGDRWTLLILRDCFLGVRRFDVFEKRLGITRHILADRLKKLLSYGVLYKSPYQERPLREEYRLSEKGLELHSVILGLVSWGDRYMSDERGAPIVHVHKSCGHQIHPITSCPECGEAITAKDITLELGTNWDNSLGELLPTRNT